MKYLPYVLGAVILYFIYKEFTKTKTSTTTTTGGGASTGGGSKSANDLQKETEASIKRAMGLS